MWLRMTLTGPDFEQAIAEMLPLKVALDVDDPDRFLWLDRLIVVEVTDEGVRAVVAARVQWEVIGIKVPLTLPMVAVTLTPRILQRDGRDVLQLAAHIDDADLSAVPDLIESPLILKVNKALTRENARIVWDFMHTLDFHFRLPDAVTPVSGVRWHAVRGVVEQMKPNLVLAAEFQVQRE